MGHSGFGIFVVTSDDQRAAILRACWFSVSSKVSGINMVEGFDDLRGWQMGLQRIRPCGELMPLRLFGSTTIDRSAGMEKANTRGTADATGGRRRRAWRAIQRRSGGPAMSLSSRRKKATKLRRNLKSAHAKCRLIQLEEGEANQLLRSCMLIGHIADATKRCDRPARSSQPMVRRLAGANGFLSLQSRIVFVAGYTRTIRYSSASLQISFGIFLATGLALPLFEVMCVCRLGVAFK
jgi:hypothetical protein